jgi:hypothetical protein
MPGHRPHIAVTSDKRHRNNPALRPSIKVNDAALNVLYILFALLYNAVVIQIYFLSILCNALSGFVLLSDGLEGEGVSKGFFRNSSFRLCLGLVTAVVGILKFLSVVPGNYPVVGDIAPALGGLFSGVALLYEFYRAHATIPSKTADSISGFISMRKKVIGGIAIAAAVLHFLFPTALFL